VVEVTRSSDIAWRRTLNPVEPSTALSIYPRASTRS